MEKHKKFLSMAIDLAKTNVENGGRPFGAIITLKDEVISTGINEIVRSLDPTSHAELNAIKEASFKLKTPNLEGCVVYASGQPCPMCLAAIHMCGIKEVYFANSNEYGEPYGLSTERVYQEMRKPLLEQAIKIHHLPLENDLYKIWVSKS